MELHHRIVLAFAVGAAVLPALGLRMHARKNLCHVGSLGCCGLAILIYVVYAWIMARQENWFDFRGWPMICESSCLFC